MRDKERPDGFSPRRVCKRAWALGDGFSVLGNGGQGIVVLTLRNTRYLGSTGMETLATKTDHVCLFPYFSLLQLAPALNFWQLRN